MKIKEVQVYIQKTGELNVLYLGDDENQQHVAVGIEDVVPADVGEVTRILAAPGPVEDNTVAAQRFANVAFSDPRRISHI